jgi:hypothetical protein
MKKAKLLAVALMLVSTSAMAELPPNGYIGIYRDASHSPTANSVCPAQYGQFQAWIWCLPSVNGMQAAEFAVTFPATIITLATVQNPLISVALGSLPAGISVAFAEGSCQLDWAWTHQLTLMSLAPPIASTKIDIIKHPGTLPNPAYQFASCLPGYPIESITYLTPLYICQEGAYGVEETNWGAIKSLF